ncbi:MAG: hypothetical protein HKM02_03715 [Pseudomonadales bacterium]|nr:hypothetical protein [Pseudomonadales bacterium]
MTVIATLKPAVHDAESTTVRHQLASNPAYRIGWMEGKLAQHKVMQSQQHVLSEDMAAMKKLYRDVFRLAAEVRLQSENRQPSQHWQHEIVALQQKDDATQTQVQDLKGQVNTLSDHLQQYERDVLPWATMTSKVHELLKQGQEVHGHLVQRMEELEVQHALQHDTVVKEHMEHATRLDERVQVMLEQVMHQVQAQAQEHSGRQQQLLTLCQTASDMVEQWRLQHDDAARMQVIFQKSQEAQQLALDQVQSLLGDYALEHQDWLLMQKNLQDLQTNSARQLAVMDQKIHEHQEVLFRHEALQERTEAALLDVDEAKQVLTATLSLKDALVKDVQSVLQRSHQSEAMLSQLLVDAHQRSAQVDMHIQSSQRMQEQQVQAFESMQELREQVQDASAAQNNLQARSLLNLSRAEELIQLATRVNGEVQQSVQQVQETAIQQQACYQDVVARHQQIQTTGLIMEDRLLRCEQVSLRMDEGREALEHALEAEKQARQDLQEQEAVHERLHHENAELFCQLQAHEQREEALQQQWQLTISMAAQLQKQVEQQAEELKRSRSREEQWMQALQEHEQQQSLHNEALAQKDKQVKQWHKIAVDALRRLKEAELAQREVGVNQKEHQWLMTQTRQEQVQLHRERQAMQTQLQDLEARLQEMLMGQQEGDPRGEAWKPALEQMRNQMLECRLEIARLRSLPAATPVAAIPVEEEAPVAASASSARRWWR